MRHLLPPPPPGHHVEITGLPAVAVRGYELLSQGRYLSNLLGIGATGLVLAVLLPRRKDAVRAVLAALLATGSGMFLLWLTGTPLTPLTVALGSLTAAVGCEFTVLLAEAARTNEPALKRSVMLAATTSAAGYVVLTLSSVPVIRQFGALLPCSVGLSLASALFVTQFIGQARSRRGEQGASPVDAGNEIQGVNP